MPDTPVPRPSGSNSQAKAVIGTCPQWCVGGHDDEPEPTRHCSETALVPGIALVPGACRDDDGDGKGQSRMAAAGIRLGNLGAGEGCISMAGGDCAVGVALSVVLHQRNNCPLTWVYIGDGSLHGLEISAETAWLLVRGLQVVLEESGGATKDHRAC